MTNNQPQADLQLTMRLLEGLVPSGPTDPIAYYRRPLIGRFFRERINLGLRMIADRRYATALEVGYGAGAGCSPSSPAWLLGRWGSLSGRASRRSGLP